MWTALCIVSTAALAWTLSRYAIGFRVTGAAPYWIDFLGMAAAAAASVSASHAFW